MAIYMLETKIVSRKAKNKKGKPVQGKTISVIAKAAYRSGEKLWDAKLGRFFNYASRSQEVLHSEILAPLNVPEWLKALPVHLGSRSRRFRGSRLDKIRAKREKIKEAIEKARKEAGASAKLTVELGTLQEHILELMEKAGLRLFELLAHELILDLHSQRERLWNTIEQVEKRSDSQLAREFVIALPVELNLYQQLELVREWCRQELVSHGFVVDFAIHKSKDGHNPHVHILCTLRPADASAQEGFGKKPDTQGKFNRRGSVGVEGKNDLQAWRKSWQDACNDALKTSGSKQRIDHRTLQKQGIDRIPEPKIGVNAIAMQRRGVVADPERVKVVRQVRFGNQILSAIKAVSTGATMKRPVIEIIKPPSGTNAIALQRKAFPSDPPGAGMAKVEGVKITGIKIESVRQAGFDKQISGAIKAVETTGEVRQTGAGKWWDTTKRKLVKVREQAGQAIEEQSTRWREFVKSRKPEQRLIEPPPDKPSWADKLRKRGQPDKERK